MPMPSSWLERISGALTTETVAAMASSWAVNTRFQALLVDDLLEHVGPAPATSTATLPERSTASVVSSPNATSSATANVVKSIACVPRAAGAG